MPSKFELAPGYFVLNETNVQGEVPSQKTEPELFAIYEMAKSIRAKAYYEIPKNSVSTPFGYYISEDAMPTLDLALRELQAAAEAINNSTEVAGRFICLINWMFLRADTKNRVFRQRMCSFTLEKLYDLRLQLLTRDPKTHAKMLGYTHDTTKRLDMYLLGDYAKTVQNVVESSKDLVHKVRVKEHPKIEVSDLGEIDTAIKLFEACMEKEEMS